MTRLLSPRCEHPEDQLSPLPFDGAPARADEWECGACGEMQIQERKVSMTLGGVDISSSVRDLSINLTTSVDALRDEIEKANLTMAGLKATFHLMPLTRALRVVLDSAYDDFDVVVEAVTHLEDLGRRLGLGQSNAQFVVSPDVMRTLRVGPPSRVLLFPLQPTTQRPLLLGFDVGVDAWLSERVVELVPAP